MNKDIKYWFCSLISLLFMLGFQYIPPIGDITPYGMEVVGIMIGMIIAFCTVGMIWPSIVALLLLGLSGDNSVMVILRDAFGHTVVLYMFILLIMGKMLEDSGLTGIFSNWLISRKFAQNRPWILSTLILLAGFICALFIGMIAPALICWTIVIDIAKQAGYKKGDMWPTYMIFTIMFLCTVASLVFPFQLGVIANFGILTQVSSGEIVNKFIPYLICSSIICSLIFIASILFGKYIVKPDMKPLLKQVQDKEYKLSFTKHQKSVLFLFSIFILGLFLPSILQDNIMKMFLDNLGSTGWSALIVASATIFKVDGKPLLDFNKATANGIIWDIIFMMAAIFTMSSALTSETTGFAVFILETIAPMLGNCEELFFMVILIVITMILANLINNIAVCAIIIPIAYTLSNGMNINILVIVTLMNIVGNLGFLLPSSSSQSAMIIGHEWVDLKRVRFISLGEMGISLLTTVLCIPIANFIIG